MVLVYLFCLFVFQALSVLSDGINLPSPPLAYKSPTDQRTLSILLLPNVCSESPTSYIPPGTRLISSTPIASEEPCVIHESSQPIDLSSASFPFKTVSISAPQTDPYLQPMETPLQRQQFHPNIAITPQISAVPQINLPNLESCDFVKNSVILNDCPQKVIPPIVQRIPGYFVTCKDNYGNANTPKMTMNLDNLPNNIIKLKVTELKPVFIDNNKQTKSCQTPTALTSVNPIEIQNLGNPSPNLQVIPNLVVDNSNQLKEIVPQVAPIRIVEKNPILPLRPINIPTNEQCIKSIPEIEQATNAETPTSTGKVLYPINNVKFNYGSNVFNPFLNACPEKIQPVTPPKLVPTDNIGLIVSPVVNAVDNGKSAQCDIKSPDNGYCNCNNINLLPMTEPTSCYLKSPLPSGTFNQVYFPKEELPIPISKLPHVNTIAPTQSSTLPCPVLTKPIVETASDSFTSGLSYSLNNIISLLTTGLMSKLFGTMSPEKSLADFIPLETCDALTYKEPVIDTLPSITIQTPIVLNPPLATCSGSVKSSPILPNLSIELKESDSRIGSKISSELCTDSAPKRKPYIASITINITPNTEASNDIIIIV